MIFIFLTKMLPTMLRALEFYSNALNIVGGIFVRKIKIMQTFFISAIMPCAIKMLIKF